MTLKWWPDLLLYTYRVICDRMERSEYRDQLLGVWRSWLARAVWDREVEGSSPFTPTTLILFEHAPSEFRFGGVFVDVTGVRDTSPEPTAASTGETPSAMFSPSLASFASLRDLSDPPTAQRAAWWSRVTISLGSVTG